ncbi:hypothetical protein [Mesorhizobium denitrificans]|uniref:Uncharacterized protein n=1 Tax=Mesorhizobium denitrificans TaxID=2294114 RepID=A0A371XDF2_9HYPH|nr:hypothetical protein [Mesorhizobium denitrificans]RFC67256.1 hypothetical protein DY251_11900 [Mesorhizobium denitrificans]
MSTEFDIHRDTAGFSTPRSEDASVQALYHAASRLADARRGTPRFKTRDLVGLLLSHGARTWRNSQPRAVVRLRVRSPEGRLAVRINFG